MNKVIGLINAWSCDTFIEPAMLQAVEYCDEVIVSVAQRAHNRGIDFVEKYACGKFGDRLPSVQTHFIHKYILQAWLVALPDVKGRCI